MMMIKKLPLVIPALAMMLGCKKQQWNYQEIQSGFENYNVQKLTYKSPNHLSGIDVEISQIRNNRFVYFIVQYESICEDIPGSKGLPCYVEASGLQEKFNLVILDGGQRFVLPAHAQKFFFERIYSGEDIKVVLAGHQQIIPCRELQKKLILLENPPRFRNPIHSPI